MNLIAYLINLIYPEHCLFCDVQLHPDNHGGICDICAKGEAALWYPTNKRLAIRNINRAYVCYKYEGGPREAIHRFKFEGKIDYAESIAKIMAKTIENCGDYDIIIPIPIGKERAKERKYNQSLLIARLLARYIGSELLYDVLIKIKETPKQSATPAKDRMKNIIGAFAVRSRDKIAGKRILIVDDVCTTGATLSEAAKILSESGAGRIDTVTFAATEMKPWLRISNRTDEKAG